MIQYFLLNKMLYSWWSILERNFRPKINLNFYNKKSRSAISLIFKFVNYFHLKLENYFLLFLLLILTDSSLISNWSQRFLSFMKLLIIIFTWIYSLRLSLCGRITPFGSEFVILSNTNPNSVADYYFSMQFETSLPATGYIEIIFP